MIEIKRKILLVEHDLTICDSIKSYMQSADIYLANSVPDALNNFIQQEYCLVIMDFELPETDTLAMIGVMRSEKRTPILVLTSSMEPDDIVTLFQAGANACLEKPADMGVCVAQSEALMQLYCDSDKRPRKCYPITFGTELIINPLYRQVVIDGIRIDLTRTEFDLFFCLAQHPGQVWSRSQLYSYVWDDDLGSAGDNTVRAHIGNLRKKLADAGKNYIQNSRGVGYKFVPPGVR